MNTKGQNQGNSSSVRLPKHIAEATSLGVGAHVEVSERDGVITITPVREVAYDLDALLDWRERNAARKGNVPDDVLGLTPRALR